MSHQANLVQFMSHQTKYFYNGNNTLNFNYKFETTVNKKLINIRIFVKIVLPKTKYIKKNSVNKIIFLKKSFLILYGNKIFQNIFFQIFITDYSYPQNSVNLQKSVSTGFQIYSNVQKLRFYKFQIYSNVQISNSTCFRFFVKCRFRFLLILELQVRRGTCILSIFRVLLFTQIMYSKHSRFNENSGFHFLLCRMSILLFLEQKMKL